ncbi:DUF4826 family protein [Aestuariibacter halophilus]|uniref:DUF4826 family protein n=1 Tax=Fluctibacter halophilus TaxID=226011 RepID=A0ABS8G5C5_9ALTE|nr:DUF4826 family protein [Aestuariibacter halophilus]MCC2615326.1 DUF4826 family protein [Aestuariibacter halophilus]
MSSDQQNPQMDQQQLQEWVRAQFQKANKFLAENGVLFDAVITEDSRYLAPYLALWKIKAQDKSMYWVMAGDLPTDFMAYGNASTARDALRHFSMSWQVKAENIRRTAADDKTQLAFAQLLEARAENLYTMSQQDSLWENNAG